jgi:hypothetical protein
LEDRKPLDFKSSKFKKSNLLVFTVVFVLIGAYVIFRSFAATGETANLFVDANGGTCTRSSSPATYNDAAACASLNSAYQAASLGDTVIVKGGTYTSQTILENAAKASTSDLADVVFQPAASEAVVVRGIDSGTGDGSGGTNGADHMTFRGFKMDHDGNRCDFRLRPDTYDITIEGTDVCSVAIIQASNITIKNNTLGPCYGNELYGACTNNRMESGSNISWINNTFTEYTRPFTSNPPEGWHWECMAAWPVDNLVIRGNRFERCATVTLALYSEPGASSCSYTWSGVTVESNIFDRPTDIDNNYASSGQPAVQIKDGANLSNFMFRQNSYAPGTGVLWDSGFGCAKTNFKEIGDVGNGLGCGNGVSHTYNMMGGLCNSGDDSNNVAFTNPFVNNALLGNGGDLHLAGAIGSTAADNKVPAAFCAPIDIDGEHRPADTNCDAGADERGVNTTPPPPPPPPPPTAKPGDVNGDNVVNIIDLSLMLASFGQSTSQCATNNAYRCDLSTPADNIVNIIDLSILLSHYGI